MLKRIHWCQKISERSVSRTLRHLRSRCARRVLRDRQMVEPAQLWAQCPAASEQRPRFEPARQAVCGCVANFRANLHALLPPTQNRLCKSCTLSRPMRLQLVAIGTLGYMFRIQGDAMGKCPHTANSPGLPFASNRRWSVGRDDNRSGQRTRSLKCCHPECTP